MKALSNSPLQDNVAGSVRPAEYRPARPDELSDALALLLGSGALPAQPQQVHDFVQFAGDRGIDIRNLWVAGADGRLGWAILPVVSPGRTMLLLTASSRPNWLDPGPLIEAVCQRFAVEDVQLAQVLVAKDDPEGNELFLRHRFSQMAEMLYLQLSIRRTLATPMLPEGWSWRNYSPQSHDLFGQTILESYQQSLDCPGLNGMRKIEDIMAGHKATGQFDPRFWYLLLDGKVPRAVLLLNRVPRSESADLVYLGLTPPARGRDIGGLVIRHALWAVRQMGLCNLTLAVDAKNLPALRLYYRHGMQQVGRKTALIRDLRA